MELGLQPLGRLSDRVYHTIRKEILAGKLAPGAHLALEEISQNLRVSTTPVRDALNLLANEGLVEQRPRKGAYVAQFTPKFVEESYQVREFLECAAVDFALRERATVLPEMERLVAQMASASIGEPQADPEAYAYANIRFHALPIECVGNAKLGEIFAGLSSTIALGSAFCPPAPRRANEAMAEHLAIVEALRRGDGEAMRAATRDHLRRSQTDILRRIAPGEEPA